MRNADAGLLIVDSTAVISVNIATFRQLHYGEKWRSFILYWTKSILLALCNPRNISNELKSLSFFTKGYAETFFFGLAPCPTWNHLDMTFVLLNDKKRFHSGSNF